MPNVIQATRPEVSRTFPIPGFRVRTDIHPAWGEVAVATSPDLLFDPAARERRSPGNFYSSRDEGLFPIERGEAVYLLPPNVMGHFAGQPRLYYAVAIYPQRNFQNAKVSRLPLETVPYINISSSYRGQSPGILDVPNPRGGLTGNGYGNAAPGSLEWGGDVAPAGEMVTVPAPASPERNAANTATNGGNGAGANGRQPANGNGASQQTSAPTAEQAGIAFDYDDGFDPSLWSRPQAFLPPTPVARAMRIVRPDYVPSDPQQARIAIRDFVDRYERWRTGVSNTRIFPHSAICQLAITFPHKRGIGTGFYIAPDLILTCGHNLKDASRDIGATSVRIIPGKNGDMEPFGSFTVRQGAWEVHPRYDGTRDHDLAVIRVGTPPPHGQYFDTLESLTQSIQEKIVVCGYAAERGDEDKQNLDGDRIRDVSQNLELIRYNLQTEPGNSGSPVFYITGVEDHARQMSVPFFPVIGVHVSAVDQTLNQGCRLSEEKINWIYSVGRRSSSAQAWGGETTATSGGTQAYADDSDRYGIEEPLADDLITSEAQGYGTAFGTQPDYPGASSFTQARWYRSPSSPRTIRQIVIHITDGRARTAARTARYFQDPRNRNGDPVRASAHYVIGQDGDIVQMVRHSDIAWHAGSANSDSIGIEHQANTQGMDITEEQYCLSAALVRWLCEQYSIPMDRTHILGHSEADPDTGHRGCPNALWDWEYFMGMVTSGSCYPMTQAAHALQQARQSGPTAFDADAISRMQQTFVGNAQQGSPMNCIVVTNAGLRQLYGGFLQNEDGSNKRLGSTVQDTMGALQRYGLAASKQEFEFNTASGNLTRGVARPHTLRQSVEQWLLDQAEANQMSAWYVFGLSIMDGYHTVLLPVQFSGKNNPDTHVYWADQIYSGWDDVSGTLDDRITRLTQQWWDPLPQNRKARTRVTVWPLQVPIATGSAQAKQEYDDIEGYEEEPVMAQALQRSEQEIQACVSQCTDNHCPTNAATTAGTANFSLAEFRCRDGTEVPERFRGNVQQVMENLEELRAELGNRPITVNSGYRTCSYNCTLSGAARQSRHLCGQAADITVEGHTPEQVHATIQRLIRAGRMQQGGLGLYNTFVHYDVRGTAARWDRRR